MAKVGDAQHENEELLKASDVETVEGEQVVDWEPKEKERPYSEAITEEHREFLAEHGREV